MTVRVRQPVSRSKHHDKVPTRLHSRMPKKDKFRNSGEQRSADRIPDERWESHKNSIVTKYKESTLNDTMQFMEKFFDFKASRRQYVHRFGPTKWNIVKYKGNQSPNSQAKRPCSKPSRHPSPSIDTSAWHPQINSVEEVEAYHKLSELLLHLGDLHHAFSIKASLYRAINAHTSDLGDPERKRRLLKMCVIDCIRIAPTEEMAKAARQMLEESESGLLYEDWAETDNSWKSVLFRILASRTYDSENSESSIIQIVEIINKTTVEEDESGQEKLQTLALRDFPFDLLMYKIFSYALERYNEPTAVDEEPIDIYGLLAQFKDSQPAVKDSVAQQINPLFDDKWKLLLTALNFCISAISQISIDHLERDNKATRSNAIFYGLWRIWRNHASGWKDEETYAHFSVLATELLSIAVGMMLDEAPEDLLPALPPKQWAERGAKVVGDLVKGKNTVLIGKFLKKAYDMNTEVMLEDKERQPLDDAARKQLNILRQAAAQELGIADLPDLLPGAFVTQPLSASWIESGPVHQKNKKEASQSRYLQVNTKQSDGFRPRSRSHSPSGTSSSQSQSPAPNGNANGQGRDSLEENEDRIHLD